MSSTATPPTDAPRRAPHVIVVGNEKGGTGKSTVCMHLITALLEAGKSVGSIDLDVRQQTLTRYIQHRENLVGRRDLHMPEHISMDTGNSSSMDGPQPEQSEAFVKALGYLRAKHEFVVLDCPSADTYLSRLGHAAADTLITPVNESFVDLDMLADLDPNTLEIIAPRLYSEKVWSCKQARAQADGSSIDWVVLRNRTTHIHAKNRHRIEDTMAALADRLGFREVAGLRERVVYREMFPAGLTLIDLTEEESGVGVTASHVAARDELHALLDALSLPGVAAS